MSSVPNLQVFHRTKWMFAGGIIATILLGGSFAIVNANGITHEQSAFVSVVPTRILDTRATARIGAMDGTGSAHTLQVTGVIATSAGSTEVVPAGATAVSLNVTAVDTQASDDGGYVTIYPCGNRPTTSNLNFSNAQIIPNAVTSPLSANGTLCIYVFGRANILIDVVGYYELVTGSGQPGLQGEPGIQGVSGSQGIQGIQGIPGPQGLSGSVYESLGGMGTTNNNLLPGNFLNLAQWGTTGDLRMYCANPGVPVYSFKIVDADLSFVTVSVTSDGSTSILTKQAVTTNQLATLDIQGPIRAIWKFTIENPAVGLIEINSRTEINTEGCSVDSYKLTWPPTS